MSSARSIPFPETSTASKPCPRSRTRSKTPIRQEACHAARSTVRTVIDVRGCIAQRLPQVFRFEKRVPGEQER